MGETLNANKNQNLTLKMKILFKEILPFDVLLYAETKNNLNLSILGAFGIFFFLHLTLKITVSHTFSCS
jgi:hypothetical protein